MSKEEQKKTKAKKKRSDKAGDESSAKKARKGHGWNEFEETALIKEMKEGKSIAAIAKAHDRTEGAIQKRLIVLFGKMLKDGAAFETALKAIKMSKDEFADFLIKGKPKD